MLWNKMWMKIFWVFVEKTDFIYDNKLSGCVAQEQIFYLFSMDKELLNMDT